MLLRLGSSLLKQLDVISFATGDVGYIAASIKTVADTRVGDTVTLRLIQQAEPLHGYKQMNPMVFAGLYPIESNKYNDFREALEKLQLNDASLQFEPKLLKPLVLVSVVVSWVFFMDVIQERFEREFNIDWSWRHHLLALPGKYDWWWML